jgi:ribosome maturation factor RimP
VRDLFQIYREKILKLVEPVVEAEGMELIDVKCLKMKSRWLVKIYIDKGGCITLDDCSEVSNEVCDLLNIHEVPPGLYTLEVSSPGPNRPLVRDRDFIKYRGYRIKVKLRDVLDGKRNFRGKLMDLLEEDGLKVLVIDEKGKVYRIPREVVVKANLDGDIVP